MKKEEADTLKQFVDEEDGFGKNPLSVMSEEDYKSDLECLEILKDWLSEGIHNYSLDTTQELIDDENKKMIGVFWFSRGLTTLSFALMAAETLPISTQKFRTTSWVKCTYQ